MTSDRDRIEHMLQGIARIEEAMKNVSREDFFQSWLMLDAMSFNFAILGEAANKVSDALQAKHEEIPWGRHHRNEKHPDPRLCETPSGIHVGCLPKRFGSPETTSSGNPERALSVAEGYAKEWFQSLA